MHRISHCRYFLSLMSLVVGVLSPSGSAFAQDQDVGAGKAGEVDVTKQIDEIFAWVKPGMPGCAVAVSLNGKVVVNRAFGLADLEREATITPSTIFDAGSVTKQFVAAATLILVEEGRLSLTEDIRAYVPELPDYGHKITLDHLMTHTSGVRDWTGILPLASGDPDALTVVLRQRGTNFAPGEEMSYSNSGYVLLKEIVARASGVSFSEFASKRLFEPLGMTSTQYLIDLRRIVKGRALAYEIVDDGWTLDMKLDNNRGGGGALLSTPSDLLIWNEALTSGRLGSFVTEKLHEPAKLNNGRTVGYGRGLFLATYRGAKEIQHTGGAAGYGTYLGRYPEHGLSIAIMCNAGEAAEPTRLAHRLFDLFVPSAGEIDAAGTETGPPPSIPEASLAEANGKIGLFFSDRTGESLRLAVDRGRFRIAGGPGLVLVADDRFRRWGDSLQFMSGDRFELEFLSADEFNLRSMDGSAVRYRRARPFAPTADELAAFAGRYESDEIGTVFAVQVKGDGLAVCLEHSPQTSLDSRPVDADTFQINRGIMRFIRDASGNVVGLDYSNPVFRSIRFTRLNDRPERR